MTIANRLLPANQQLSCPVATERPEPSPRALFIGSHPTLGETTRAFPVDRRHPMNRVGMTGVSIEQNETADSRVASSLRTN
jgi:hypothetical protein